MVTALGILVLPGMLVNNLQAEGIVVNNPPMVCSNGTCVLSQANPCNLNPSPCNLSGSSFQVLNPCSTWTNLLTLNFVGLLDSFFSKCGQATQQSQTLGGINATFTGNETIPGLVPVFGKHSVDISSGQSQWTSSVFPHPIKQGVTLPVILTCLGWQTVGYTNTHGFPAGTRTQSAPAQCVFLDSTAAPNQIALSTGCWLFGNTTDINNAICTNWAPGSNVFTDTGGSLPFNPGNILGFFLGLLGGAILLLLAMGVNVQAATVGVGSNPQGTKMAQTWGLGLLIWFPLYSEFSTWFTNGYLPVFNSNNGIQTGLDGNILAGQIGIVSIILTVMMFLGLYFMSQTPGAASS